MKLNEYESIKKQNLTAVFTGNDVKTDGGNLEEKFGFEETVLLNDSYGRNYTMELDLASEDIRENNVAVIIIKICSTGQVLKFSKKDIIIGRSPDCDMTLKQPSLSRRHVRVVKMSEDEYELTDLNSSNGTYVTAVGSVIPRGESVVVSKGANIRVGSIELQLC